MKICCFTGHRPKLFPWGDNLSDPRAQALLSALQEEIEQAAADGYDAFMCGGALGVDTWAAQTVRKLGYQLILALPFAGYNRSVAEALKADETIIVSDMRGTPGFNLRNRYMVDHSQRIIAVYDERSGLRGGTYRTLEYARRKGIEVRQIRWMG